MNNNPQDKMLKSDEYDILSRFQGGFTSIPDHISLNLRHELRPYQTEALGRYLHYYDNDQNRDRTRGIQLLFNMATGSGKTLIMAALLLDLYKRGQNKIIFFVNTRNIIEKTRENFLDSSSNKYLFSEKIVIDGEVVNVREVTDFSDAHNNAINIVFTTIQELHITLKAPKENALTYDDLAEHDLVLLSDEAHHLNVDTKKLNADKQKDNNSWESTINTVMNGNHMTHLFEFTATIDLDDKEIFYKYKNRIIYRYDLRAFREDGYSKDVWIYDVAADLMDRAIQAMIISQYRKKIALSAGVWLKPIILFKSFRIADANDFYDEFVMKVKSISHNDIEKQRKFATGILDNAYTYFDQKGISTSDLKDEIRFDFAEERLLSVTKKAITSEDQQRLNSLEDRDNEIRAVFAVDVLDEGWDVLNLFDIVRLYDTRDSKNGRPGKTTMREAQLIGRGARYYPFTLDGDEERRFVRKFDDNELEPLRVIEQLHYHSASNPKYIQEIRQTLRETGIMPNINTVKREINLKESFKETHTFKSGFVWKNEQVEAAAIPEQIALLGGEGYKLQDIYEISVPVGISHDRQIFVDNSDLEDQMRSEEHAFNVTFSRFPKNLVRYAVDRNKKLRYDIVAQKISGLNSLEGFLTGNKQLGGVRIAVTAGVDRYEKLITDERLFIVEKLLELVANDIALNEKSFEGTKEFKPHQIKKVFDERILRNYTITDNDAEFGISQSHPGSFDQRGSQYYLDLSKEDWHAYDDNFGTSEEKKLVLLIKKLIDELREKWDDVYLVRNEGSFKIYEFGKPGRAFEPDYVLFANDKRDSSVSWQIFIEPKGGHLIEHDAWKQDFLLKISSEAKIIGEDSDGIVIGVPFYNDDVEKHSHVLEETLKSLDR